MLRYLCLLSVWANAEPAPTFQEPYCPAKLNKTERQNQKFHLAIEIYKASKINPFEPYSLWNQDYLSRNPGVKKALTEFIDGKRGQALKSISLLNKTATSLHQELIAAGFTWKEVPLSAGKSKFWLINGEKTTDVTTKDVVKMQIYIHKDGSMVRIKSRGVPDNSGNYPQRTPHVIQAVLITFNPDHCMNGSCAYDTDYLNEAFKVTAEGHPVPKSPSPKFGFKPPLGSKQHHRLRRLAGDILMNLVHTELNTDCTG